MIIIINFIIIIIFIIIRCFRGYASSRWGEKILEKNLEARTPSTRPVTNSVNQTGLGS